MRRPNSHTHMTRRAAMAGAMLAPLALPALAAPALIEDPHPEWLTQWRAARAAVNGVDYDADLHPMWPVYEALEKRVMETPARTAAGVAAQLMLLAEEQAYGLTPKVTDALQRAAAMLGRL